VHRGDFSSYVECAILIPPGQENNSNGLQERNDDSNNKININKIVYNYFSLVIFSRRIHLKKLRKIPHLFHRKYEL
jgi:hypothetical protein